MSSNGHKQAAPDKSLYRIGEVSRITGTKPFVLRFWETEFPMLQPEKSAKGHRLYRREDVETVLHIKRLLYDEGFTIAGARRYLKESDGAPKLETRSAAPVTAEHKTPPPAPAGRHLDAASRKALFDVRETLRSFLTLFENE